MIENMAPVLGRVFSPLFAITLLAFVVGVVATWTWVGDDRDVLIVFDLLLAVVLGLHLYAVSAREPAAGPGSSTGCSSCSWWPRRSSTH